ncbi:prefoldin, beta subunit [Pyrolobus fumarii 1A]|uniref:Prefoldin subunit beta n=1 Tax=Pyrolobus fumarii (strain DSM 11204 / 1A) TaxID=694429 RepID=G0EE07_PYRF1|nr:prefoldin subunit beta [Pyrolobus fumarii]AEM37923.1 prefoldin, beta subunit [Pyrolobus fumarii 1A]
MAQRLPPELESKVAEAQRLQEQLNRVVQERVALESEKSEIERVLKLLEEVQENEVYRSVGGILVRVSKEKVANELKDRLELIDIRLEKLRKQENELRKRLEQLLREIREYQVRLQAGTSVKPEQLGKKGGG